MQIGDAAEHGDADAVGACDQASRAVILALDMGQHARAAQRVDADAVVGRARDEHISHAADHRRGDIADVVEVDRAGIVLVVGAGQRAGRGVDREDADAVIGPPAIRKAVAPIVTVVIARTPASSSVPASTWLER